MKNIICEKNGAECGLLYGKRRVGKTELLNEFARRHKALYLIARQETYEGQLKKMSSEIAEFFKDNVLRHCLRFCRNIGTVISVKRRLSLCFEALPLP